VQGGSGPEGHPFPQVGEKPFQAMDVRQENEELRCLADVLLVPESLATLYLSPGSVTRMAL
jgi:hypothetical protein